MTQLVSEAGHVQTVVQAAPRPLSSTSLISPPPTTVTAASRAAKSGNGSGNNTTGILKSGTTTQHHHNSHRATKRAGSNASINSHHSAHSHNTHTTASISAHSPGSHSHDNDGRPKRVWKACERCRMKKTKCDGEFPCKRCKDDGLVCTAGTRKKTEYKQIPKGYAEVLENTQVALVATIHKLYAMVQSGQSWTLGEPELNERGQPVIHSIASKLGCIRPNNDPDLPFGSAIFPESDKDLNDLQSQLNDFHKQREAEQAAHPELTTTTVKTEEPTQTQTTSQQPAARKRLSAKALPPVLLSASAPTANSLPLSFDAASASSLEDMDNLSDLEDHRKNMFGRGNRTSSSVQSAGTMSPQSLTFNDFDSVATTGTSQADSITMPTISSPTITSTTLHNWMAQPGMNLPNMNGMNGLNSMNGISLNSSTIQHQQPAPSQQALEMHMRQQRIVNNLQSNRTLQYQQAQQQYSPEQLPLSTVSMSASNMTLAGSNPTFFAADMLPHNMFDFVIKPDMMGTDAMMGGVDPMIFDGSFDEPMMS